MYKMHVGIHFVFLLEPSISIRNEILWSISLRFYTEVFYLANKSECFLFHFPVYTKARTNQNVLQSDHFITYLRFTYLPKYLMSNTFHTKTRVG